ncbi:hypothetical protein Tco_1451132, partial [Tanacetum coccineum]
LRMTKVIKGEFEKLEDLKVEDVSLTCDTSLEVFNNEFNRMSGMDDDLFTYDVEVTNIPCDSNKDNDSEQRMSHEADDDMGYDPSDVAFTEWLGGYDEVELTDEEFSDDEDEVAGVFRIDTNIFDFETPLCLAFSEFNYLLKVDPDLLTKDIMGFKTYEDYKDVWIYEWNENVPWVYDNPWLDNGIWKEPKPVKHDCKPFNYKTGCSEWPTYNWREDGSISDDESCNYCWRRWKSHEITYHDHNEIENETHDERQELYEAHELPVCNIRRFKMIKYSFGQDEEYVVVKEDEYDDLAKTSDDACRAYQEIFRMMDEGWMVTRAE